jgi:hypothetical protein
MPSSSVLARVLVGTISVISLCGGLVQLIRPERSARAQFPELTIDGVLMERMRAIRLLVGLQSLAIALFGIIALALQQDITKSLRTFIVSKFFLAGAFIFGANNSG